EIPAAVCAGESGTEPLRQRLPCEPADGGPENRGRDDREKDDRHNSRAEQGGDRTHECYECAARLGIAHGSSVALSCPMRRKSLLRSPFRCLDRFPAES